MSRVFISYSHKDETLKTRLEAQLSTLKDQGLIDSWHDRQIKVGDDFSSAISAELDRADIVLLLVSPDFLASRYINDIELKRAMERHNAGQARVIPVILRTCDWQGTPFGHLVAAPKDGKPVRSWSRVDDALFNVVQLIRAALPPVEAEGLDVDPRLDKEIATDVTYYRAKLETWPANSFNGEDMIDPLLATLKKVEGNRAYNQKYTSIRPMLYRMLGGAALLHSKLEMAEKLRLALPYLRRSHEIWPEQRGLEQNVSFLESFARIGGGEIKQYLTTVLQILRGPDDAQIPMLVEQLTNAAQSPEPQAQTWLLNEATPNPIRNFLQGVQLMIKKERNIDAEIEVATKPLPDGKTEVQAKVGPNIFLWEVDFANKGFWPKNELTEGLMGIVASAKG
jgi:hypothetical protein